MKRYMFKYFAALFVLIAGLDSCTEHEKGVEVTEGFSIKVFSPTKVIAGQVVTISGNELDTVTEVVFPGDVVVTDIEVVNEGLIRVVTPKGIIGGVLSVRAGEESVSAAVPVTIGNPTIATITPTDAPVGIGGTLTLTGTDMEFYKKAVFPGMPDSVYVDAVNWQRKSTGTLLIRVPAGIAAGVTPVKLIACDGSEDISGEVELKAEVEGGAEPENEISGAWVWADGDAVYGDTGSGLGFGGGWSFLPKADMGEEATNVMSFTVDSYSKQNMSGGIVESSGYIMDFTAGRPMADGNGTWSIGTIEFTGEASVLRGKPRWGDGDPIRRYEIHSLDDQQMTLFHQPNAADWGQWRGTTFWIFKRVPTAVVSATADMDLVQRQKVAIEGVNNSWWIDPDWFGLSKTAGEYNFKAVSGKYRVVKDDALKMVTVEPLNADGGLATTQADGSGAVWVIGDGQIGKPSFVVRGVNWDPVKGFALTPLGNGVHRMTVIAGMQIGDSAINFKFFHQKAWGGEFNDPSAYTNLNPELLLIGNQEVNGVDNGNIQLAQGAVLENGATYEFILDISSGPGAPTLSVTKK